MPDQGTLFGEAVLRDGVWGYHTPLGFIDERAIAHEDRPWRAFRKSIPYRPDGTPDPEVISGHEEFWANSHYLVFKRPLMVNDDDSTEVIFHLSMRTVENDVRHDWREMQRVKNELCGPEWEAVELYPAQSRVVDTANQFHLWCFPFPLPFGFTSSLVMTTEQSRPTGAVQRPFTREAP